MGVSGLFPALKKYFKFIKPALGGNVSTASFDINSLIHQVAQLVYGYGEGKDPNRLVRPVKIGTRLEFQVYRIDETNNQIHIIEQLTREELFDKFAAAFLTRLTDIINQIRPKDMVILAVDGVPPQGKIAQQRQRRFAASSAASKDTVFDQNCISPGTEFMIKLDERIREWLASMINSQNIQLPPKVIYSSHLVPGEGEHKILDIYRDPEQMVIVEPSEKKSDKSSSSKTKRQMIGQHVIYGNDNDLIPLLMLLPQDKVYNMRPRHNLDGYDYIDIDSLKMGIRKIMRHNEYYNLDGSDNSAIDDFVVVLSLLGNDFLPGQFSMRNMEDSLYFIFEAYNTVGKPITVLNDDCTNREIDWDAFTYFLIELSRNENYLITGLANTSFLIDRGDKPQLDLSSKMLNASKYDSTSREGRLMSKVNMKTFKNYWYSNALEPQCSRKANKKKGHANICAKFFAFDSSDIANLVVDYLSVIAWVYRYYQLGTWEVSSSLVYRHFHAPLLAELASVAP